MCPRLKYVLLLCIKSDMILKDVNSQQIKQIKPFHAGKKEGKTKFSEYNFVFNLRRNNKNIYIIHYFSFLKMHGY